MKSKNVLIFLFLSILSISLGSSLFRNGVEFEWDFDLSPFQYETAKVVGHLSGDTIRVNLNGKIETITLLGVLSPDNPNAKPQYSYFSSNAAEFTKKLCSYNSTVYLTYDQTEKDKYNRKLAYLWYKVNNRWIMHNLNLLANGYALISDSYFITDEYKNIFQNAEETAKSEKLGLWKKEAAKDHVEIVMSSSSELVRIATVKYLGKPLYVEIKNGGPSETHLNRWFLFSVSSKRVFPFSQIIIHPYESIKIYYGMASPENLFWEGEHIFNPNGDGVILYNEKGEQVSIYTWGY